MLLNFSFLLRCLYEPNKKLEEELQWRNTLFILLFFPLLEPLVSLRHTPWCKMWTLISSLFASVHILSRKEKKKGNVLSKWSSSSCILWRIGVGTQRTNEALTAALRIGLSLMGCFYSCNKLIPHSNAEFFSNTMQQSGRNGCKYLLADFFFLLLIIFFI